MRPSPQGFTLIELMIVVAIIGTLAAIAIPAYQDYTIRAQVSEGLTLASAAKAAIEDYHAQRGSWPGNNAAAALPDSTQIVGKYTDSVSVTNNVIDITYDRDAHLLIQGRKVVLTATDDDGSISWQCTAVGIEPNHLPRVCRAAAIAKKKKS